MTRRVIHRVVVIVLVSWVCSQAAVAGGSSIAADHHATETLHAPGHPDGSPSLAAQPPGSHTLHDAARTPFAGLDTVIGWVNVMLLSQSVLSQSVGVGGAAWFVPPIILTTGSSHRTDDPSFENERREAVYQEIAESPGHYIAALAASTGIPESTVRYHVRVLEDEGLVCSALIRGKRCYYLHGVDRWIVTLEAALTDDSTAPILEAIARSEPADVTTVAEEVDVARSTASYHLERLAADDLIERERTGQTVVTRLVADVRAYLDETNEFGVEDDAMSE